MINEMAAIGETHEMSVSDGDGSGPVLRGSAKPSDGGMGRNGGIQVHAPIAKHSFEVTVSFMLFALTE